MTHDIDEDSLTYLLRKFGMLSVGHQITQQTRVADTATMVLNDDTGKIRLPRYRAKRLEQVGI